MARCHLRLGEAQKASVSLMVAKSMVEATAEGDREMKEITELSDETKMVAKNNKEAAAPTTNKEEEALVVLSGG